MSRSFALIKFKKTGNIYYGCYNGTSDIMLPFLCTPQECYDETYDCYNPIRYCEELLEHNSWTLPDNITDLDDIEIYSDYGCGFYWSGTGSESVKMIKEFLNPFDEVGYKSIKDGVPEWVEEFLKRLEDV